MNESEIFENVSEEIISGDCCEIIIRIVKKNITTSLLERDEIQSPLSKEGIFFKPTVNNPTEYVKQEYHSELKVEEFVPPEKQLPGWRYERYKHGFHKKSRVVDLSNGQRSAKHSGNEARIMRAQEEQFNQRVEKLKEEHVKKQNQAIKQDMKKAQEFEQNENQKLNQVAQDNLRGVANAGFEGAKSGAIVGLVGSVVVNGMEVYTGKKTVSQAVKDTGTTVGTTALISGGISSTLTAVNTYGNSNVIIPLLFVSYQVYQEIRDYYKNGKSGAECCKSLVKLASSTAASIAGGTAAVVLASFLLPGVGTLVLTGISAVGAITASMATNRLLDVFTNILKPKPQDTLNDALLWFGLKHDNKHMVNDRYKTLRKIYHPDTGGSNESFIKLQTYYSIILASVNPY